MNQLRLPTIPSVYEQSERLNGDAQDRAEAAGAALALLALEPVAAECRAGRRRMQAP